MKCLRLIFFSSILSYLAIILNCVIIIFIFGRTENRKEKIWAFSKTLTVKDIIKKNNFETYPILNFDLNGNRNLYKSNYQNLLANSGEQCKKGFKKCGILDLMGNIMCIPEEDICPINEAKIDLESNNISYINQGYNFTYLQNLTDGYVLYYKNNETNNTIITDIKYCKEIPKYINENNLILDKEKYDEYKESLNPSFFYDLYSKNISFLFRRNKGRKKIVLRKLELNADDKNVYTYFTEKMKGNWNIHKSYQNIDMNIYKGNYIGFQNLSYMQQYNDLDLYEFDSISFPNLAAVIFGFITIPIIIVLFFGMFYPIYHIKWEEGVNLFFFLRLELPISIGYNLYIIYENSNIYGEIDKFMKIKADPFLQEHLTEIKKRKPSFIYIEILTDLLTISFLSTLLSFCFLPCLACSDKKVGNSNNEKKENLLQ